MQDRTLQQAGDPISFMDRGALQELWEQARLIDPTLTVSPRHLHALARRRLQPVSFSRICSLARWNEATRCWSKVSR